MVVVVVVVLLLVSSSRATNLTALFFNSSAVDLPDYNDRLLLYVAQGLANRKTPSVFFDTGNAYYENADSFDWFAANFEFYLQTMFVPLWAFFFFLAPFLGVIGYAAVQGTPTMTLEAVNEHYLN